MRITAADPAPPGGGGPSGPARDAARGAPARGAALAAARRGLALAACLLCALPLQAGDFAFGWDPRTGDALMDARLADINRYGDRYREAFVDELVRYHAAPRALVGALLEDERWAPGDLYFACALAEVTGRPCRQLLRTWRAAHDAGWAPVAAELGVAPGSVEFRRIAEGLEASYVRWGRPLPVSAPAPAPGD